MLFDVERYVNDMEDLRKIEPLKPPNNKVPAVNLSKLAFDKKVAPIVLDIRFGDKFILRDKFDWDLMEPRLRPIDFSRALLNQLPFFNSDEHKDTVIEKVSNSILDQIQAHIDKNTFFPRVRFGRKEEDILANDQVCVNCDSLLMASGGENCAHCGFQYEKKPGPQPAPGSQIPESIKTDRKDNMSSFQNLNQQENVKKANIIEPLKKSLEQQNLANTNIIADDQTVEEAKNQKEEINQLAPVVIHEFQVPEKITTLNKQIDDQQQYQPIRQTWKERLSSNYTFSGREKKVCKKCNEVNAFFKNECSKCEYKFPKTRGINSSLNSDNYALYFWDMLHSEPLFSSLTKVNDYLEESDFISVRDLYKKVKEILTQPNTERIFDITDTQLLELHDSIDEKFEWLLTDNELTNRIFNDATSQKSGRKRTKQVYLNFKEAQQVHDRKVFGMEIQNISQLNPFGGYSELLMSSKGGFNDDSFENPYKRLKSVAENTDQSTINQFKNRPHNFESTKMQTIISNYNMLSQMGFLDQNVMQSESINRLVNEQEEIISSLIKRRGRPKKFDLTYEDMLNVDNWDDSKLVFQTGLPGLGGDKEEEGNEGGQGNAGNTGGQGGNKRNIDFNADVCGICEQPGKLICCDDCPSAFHADCLGYERQCPRGKWKCYFCKVIKYGIRHVPRMAPRERPICDELGDNVPTWEDKALQMFEILQDYYCFRQFVDKVELTPEQKETLSKKKFIEFQEGSKEPKYQTITQLTDKLMENEKESHYQTYKHFYEDLKQQLNVFAKGLDKRDQIGMCARASLLLLEKLVEENEIFQYIKPTKKKINYRANQQQQQDQQQQYNHQRRVNQMGLINESSNNSSPYKETRGRNESSKKQNQPSTPHINPDGRVTRAAARYQQMSSSSQNKQNQENETGKKSNDLSLNYQDQSHNDTEGAQFVQDELEIQFPVNERDEEEIKGSDKDELESIYEINIDKEEPQNNSQEDGYFNEDYHFDNQDLVSLQPAAQSNNLQQHFELNEEIVDLGDEYVGMNVIGNEDSSASLQIILPENSQERSQDRSVQMINTYNRRSFDGDQNGRRSARNNGRRRN